MVVLYCKGGRGRLVVIIVVFLNYSNICLRLVVVKNISNSINVVVLKTLVKCYRLFIIEFLLYELRSDEKLKVYLKFIIFCVYL